MRFNRIMAILLIILFVNSSITMSFASESNVVKASDALKIARYHILSDIKQDPNSKWKSDKLSLSRPKEVYDIDGNMTGYLINIKSQGKKAGYVYVGNSKEEFPILSFSYEKSVFDDEQIENMKGLTNVKNNKILDVGLGRFILEVEDQNNKKALKTIDGKEIKIEKRNNLEAFQMLIHLIMAIG